MASGSAAPAAAAAAGEDELRRKMLQHLTRVTRREPLDASYKNILMHGAARAPAIPKDKMYKRLGAELRSKVEAYIASGGENDLALGRKRGRDRDDVEEEPLRAAFTLRECKKHEQEGLIAAAVAAPPPGMRLPLGWDLHSHRRRLEAMAMGLQEREKMKKAKADRAKLAAAAKAKILAAEREAAAEKGRIKATESGAGIDAAAMAMAGKTHKKEAEGRTKADADLKRQEEKDREIMERERQRSIERAKEREKERKDALHREEEEARIAAEREKEEAERRARMAETPQQALHRLYEPIFRILWVRFDSNISVQHSFCLYTVYCGQCSIFSLNYAQRTHTQTCVYAFWCLFLQQDMEFANLHGTNPFRIVIDKDNCTAMGVPDYCDIIDKPMNLTYIQEKVHNKSYVSLKEFFGDVELMISNALKYNSDPNNAFHVAAKEIKKKYKKMAKKVVLKLQQAQQHK
mmetsp:Transcript_46726/g.141594  ORF Transcript_46726/g.141594 Transcript_46726/m.141594 type:complete len:462 (-) Transcript_46726:62-1447(-)